jgi:hypothetical protein
MDVKEMEAKIKELENQVGKMKDLEEINRLQKAYGFYLEHWMYDEVIDLFSDSPDTVLNLMVGIFLGKEGVRRYFESAREMTQDPEFVHQIMQLSGVVDIDAEGKTAQGRWYGFGSVSLLRGKGVWQLYTTGIYTCDYIKEGGKWKILRLKWNPLYTAPPTAGWVKPERVAATAIASEGEARKPAKPDKPRDIETRYPTGYIVPFHFKHPVTGKKSSEAKRNASLKMDKK